MYIPYFIPPLLFEMLTEVQQNQVEKLYLRDIGKLRIVAKGFFQEDNLVHDALQITYTKIIQIVEDGNSKILNMPTGYFVRMTKNICIDILRKKDREDTVSLHAMTEETPKEIEIEDKTIQILETIVHEEGYRKIIGYIQALEERYRAPLELKLLDNLSEKEIAQTLGLPLSTVNINIYRGRQILQERIKGDKTYENKYRKI